MKFVCDRCKTRYSIGDDRVRGKILKIRCKNCANVITVREGMSADDAPEPVADSGSTRTPKKTTMAPAASHTAPAPGSVKPPAALDEEWYVSIDGEQSGPFSLADAQRWIASKSFDAELHCWSEGFDDWLPVDKVSHFRGLRKKPAAPPAQTPPPVPRVQHRVNPQPARATRAADVEDEPKPLFAATMASLESSAPPRVAEPTPAARGAAARPKATPAAGVPLAAKSNGKSGPSPSPSPSPLGKANASGPQPALRTTTRPGPGVAGQGAKAPVPGFDGPTTRDEDDDGAGSTKVDAPAYDDARAPTPTPVAPPPQMTPLPFAAAPSPSPFGAAMPAMPAPTPEPPPPPASTDDDMEIGEVSRVVNLADIARGPRKERTSPVRRPSIGRNSQAVMRVDGPMPGGAPLGPAADGSMPPMDGAGASFPGYAPGVADGYAPGGLAGGFPGSPDGAIAAEVPLAPAPQVSQRRHFIALLVVALLLVGGAGAVVIYIVVNGNDTEPVTLSSPTDHINDERPDEVIHRVFPNETPTPGSGAHVEQPHPQQWHPQHPIPTTPDHGSGTHDDGPNGPLKPDEVEDMYGRSNANTQRCWQRAQNKDPYIVKDVKRVVVTLSIGGDGGVAKAEFAGLPTTDAGNGLGSCLQSMIRNWRFRPTKDGLTAKITMAFQ